MKRLIAAVFASLGLTMALAQVPAPAELIPADGTPNVTKELSRKIGGKAFARKTAALPAFAFEQAYELTVTPKGYRVQANTETGYFYARTDSVTEIGAQYSLVRAGQFNKLVREEENDDAEELSIGPVTMARIDTEFRRLTVDADSSGIWPTGEFRVDDKQSLSIIIPTTESEDASDNQYSTVQQALELGDSVDTATRSESERMEVFFLGTGTKSFTALGKSVTLASVGTDPTIDADFKDKVSFALAKVPVGTVHVGQYHTSKSRIDGKNQRCIKFLSDEIPDPTRIFIFHNKRYVCEKIEIQITEKGIDQVKTGYFYEIVS